jgi:hypothetical protein
MAVFAIIGIDGLPIIGPKVVEQFADNYYVLTPTVWLVSDPGTARSVGDKITLSNGALGASALVVPVGVYFGWGPKGAWDWINTKVSAAP